MRLWRPSAQHSRSCVSSYDPPVTPPAEIAQILDACATHIATEVEDPYRAVADACQQLEPGSDAWLVLTWIEDLREDIRGPFSHAVSNSAARVLAREWLTLDDRTDGRTQSGFFARWLRDFEEIVRTLPPPTQADRFERDAAILAILGKNGMRAATRSGRVTLPAFLVDLAIESANREEEPARGDEMETVRLNRARADILATIGRLASASGRREADRIVVTLPLDVIAEARAAADEMNRKLPDLDSNQEPID